MAFATELECFVWDEDPPRNDLVGCVKFPISDLIDEAVKDDWYDIAGEDGSSINGQIDIRIQFHSLKPRETPCYEIESYFPVRTNCFVTLYQDAHVSKNMRQFANAAVQPKSCWKELYTAIIEAQRLIYIAGWAFHVHMKLLRGDDENLDSRSIGEILIDKANQGVSVNIIFWDDPDFLGVAQNKKGFKYFLNSNVRCIESKPGRDKTHTCPFSHHQKFILCDAVGICSRNLVGFVGGLDIAKGRWDTANHELFATLKNEHSNDFLNNFIQTCNVKEGPRQPWHDIHMKVEGPVVCDMVKSFIDRWTFDVEHQNLGSEWNIDCSTKNSQSLTSWILNANQFTEIALNASSYGEKFWKCQVFRSISSLSTNFSSEMSDTNYKSLFSEDEIKVDNSIAKAYIQAIRNAVNFIYIETQYFAGSSSDWLEDNTVICHNLIPMEITQKIVSKIRARQPFTAYILLPMFPEGDPMKANSVLQEQLLWQTRTIEMMYQKIAVALKDEEMNDESVPTDWLLFLCLGKREPCGSHFNDLAIPSDEISSRLRASRRHLIYVHSIMLIVDDSYLLAGSANLNQRSLDGARDTEITVGCWQPKFLHDNPLGDIHNFRIFLWREHFKLYNPLFEAPGSDECIGRVKEISETNWHQYNGPPGSVTPGHMMLYPIRVENDGSLHPLHVGSSILEKTLRERIFGGRQDRGTIFGKLTGYDPHIIIT